MAGGRRRRRMRRFKREKGVSSEEVERKRRARALTGVNDGSAYLYNQHTHRLGVNGT